MIDAMEFTVLVIGGFIALVPLVRWIDKKGWNPFYNDGKDLK